MKKKYRHDLQKLLDDLDGIAKRYELEDRLPRSDIHTGIIEILSDFASNVTRYYNLDLVTNSSAGEHYDPIRAWFERVTLPVLEIHYKPGYKRRHLQNALLAEYFLGKVALIRHHAETGESLNSVYEASMQAAATDFAKPYARMYLMQIVRFTARLLTEIGYAAQKNQREEIPCLGELFAIYENSDMYFRHRKTWSIWYDSDGIGESS